MGWRIAMDAPVKASVRARAGAGMKSRNNSRAMHCCPQPQKKNRLQKFTGVTLFHFFKIRGFTFKNKIAACIAGFGPEVDNPVGTF